MWLVLSVGGQQSGGNRKYPFPIGRSPKLETYHTTRR